MARKLTGREVTLLLSLGGAAVLYFWYSSRSSTATAVAEAAAAARATVTEKAPRVRMDLLTKSVEGYDAEKRDLFKYSVRPPTAEEIRRMREEEERRRKLIEEEARRRAEEAAQQAAAQRAQHDEMIKNPPKPQPPAITLKYMGLLGPKDDKVVSFLDGDEVIVVKKGETVKGLYRIVEIKAESVVIGYTSPAFRDVTRELTLAPQSR